MFCLCRGESCFARGGSKHGTHIIRRGRACSRPGEWFIGVGVDSTGIRLRAGPCMQCLASSDCETDKIDHRNRLITS